MGNRECFWTNFANFNGVDTSIKDDRLVLNAQFQGKFQGIYHSPLNTSLVTEICQSACRACQPLLSETPRTILVKRQGYKYIPEVQQNPGPFLDTTVFRPDKGTVVRTRATVVDDYDPISTAKWLAQEGFLSTSIKVDPDRAFSEILHNQLLETIINSRPGLLISDKGLGWFDGIRLITQIRERESGIWTVMFTGESDTGEPHNVAHSFVEKGYDTTGSLRLVCDRAFPREV